MPIKDLDRDIFSVILNMLDAKERAIASSVCKQWHGYVDGFIKKIHEPLAAKSSFFAVDKNRDSRDILATLDNLLKYLEENKDNGFMIFAISYRFVVDPQFNQLIMKTPGLLKYCSYSSFDYEAEKAEENFERALSDRNRVNLYTAIKDYFNNNDDISTSKVFQCVVLYFNYLFIINNKYLQLSLNDYLGLYNSVCIKLAIEKIYPERFDLHFTDDDILEAAPHIAQNDLKLVVTDINQMLEQINKINHLINAVLSSGYHPDELPCDGLQRLFDNTLSDFNDAKLKNEILATANQILDLYFMIFPIYTANLFHLACAAYLHAYGYHAKAEDIGVVWKKIIPEHLKLRVEDIFTHYENMKYIIFHIKISSDELQKTPEVTDKFSELFNSTMERNIDNYYKFFPEQKLVKREMPDEPLRENADAIKAARR